MLQRCNLRPVFVTVISPRGLPHLGQMTSGVFSSFVSVMFLHSTVFGGEKSRANCFKIRIFVFVILGLDPGIHKLSWIPAFAGMTGKGAGMTKNTRE